jgi:hypothetical protein
MPSTSQASASPARKPTTTSICCTPPTRPHRDRIGATAAAARGRHPLGALAVQACRTGRHRTRLALAVPDPDTATGDAQLQRELNTAHACVYTVTPLVLPTSGCAAAYQKGMSTKPFVVLASSWLSTW